MLFCAPDRAFAGAFFVLLIVLLLMRFVAWVFGPAARLGQAADSKLSGLFYRHCHRQIVGKWILMSGVLFGCVTSNSTM